MMDSKKLLRTLTIGQGSILIPHIDAYQDKGNFPPKWTIEIFNDRKDDQFFHPSTDCFTSPKRLWMEKKGIVRPRIISSSLRRVFDAGHLWHGYYGNILIEMGLVSPENVERKFQQNVVTKRGFATVAGTADLVNVKIPGHGNWLVDMKTMRKDDFQSGLNPDTFLKYTAQINIYGDIFQFDNLMLLAIEKDSPHRLKEIIIPKDEELVAEIYNRWTYVAQCLRADVEPDDNYA